MTNSELTQSFLDIMEIRKSFRAVVTRKFVLRIFYESKFLDLIVLYPLLIFFVITAIFWMIGKDSWRFWLLILSVIGLSSFVVHLMKKQFKDLGIQQALAEEFRADWQYVRFSQFSNDLQRKGISIDRIQILKESFPLTSDLTMLRQSIFANHPVAVIYALLIGLVAGIGGIESFWKNYGINVVVMLLIAISVVHMWLIIFPTKSYLDKELELFINWYLISVTKKP